MKQKHEGETDEEFMIRYKETLAELVDDAIKGESGCQMVLIHGNPSTQSIAIYTVNATPDEAAGLIVASAQPYTEKTTEERALH